MNFYFKNDKNQHVCEIQLVHNQLLTARKGLSGHVIYNIVRNANELLDMNKREYPTQFRSKEDLFNSLNDWYGWRFTSTAIEERSKLGLSYVPQENSLFDELTLRENLEIVIELKFKKLEKSKLQEIDHYLSRMNLKSKQHTKAKLLSGGEKPHR